MRLSTENDLERLEVTLVAKQNASADVCRLLFRSARPFDYRAGQFVNLRRADGLTRSYSLASVPGLDQTLELHIRRYPDGAMSRWLYDEAKVGQTMHVIGPHGSCFYLPGRPEQPLLLIGTGTGLAPLLGIVRDALGGGHEGPIRLYHASHRGEGLYARRQLRELARRHPNFEFVASISGPTDDPSVVRGRADDLALSAHPSLAGMRVFACGLPAMVRSVRKGAYLAGAALTDILADAFEMATPPVG
jgi:NAD(P)H-flavin reductase